ncbi:DnaT-like ssDNA-binding domain-containing protein [Pseudomonas sichuanensis]|uniref:DnaT-like ssDNA-binding domain-containing protein n=1 Tax=Pseudomonas sichuanensis TaxID=2213015 RepID=UPI00142E7B01|nr:DnaT-like ssDNA-binding domain-containing protein [Pseudomonas sichuanensis]
MPAFQINDAEYAALADEPADVFKLYCVIRRWMDYRTGVSGAVRRLSEQMFREELYIAPTRGRHESGSPTRQKVRSLVDRLISIGVITPIGPLVFQLPSADWDGSSNRSATDEQPDQQPDQQPRPNSAHANKIKACSENDGGSATRSETVDSLINNLPPLSVKSPTTLTARGYFAMHDDWNPEPKTWNATALRNAIPKAVPADTLNEFRSYWIARPEKEQSQAQWEHQLAQSLKHHIRQAQAGGYTHGSANTSAGPRPARQRSMSAVDKVHAAIAERKAREAAAGSPGQALGEDDGALRPPLDVEFRRIS